MNNNIIQVASFIISIYGIYVLLMIHIINCISHYQCLSQFNYSLDLFVLTNELLLRIFNFQIDDIDIM